MSAPLMSVNALNIKIKSLLEATFMHIRVEGEIASVTYHQASGHVYFSIKDSESSIKCVMFRSNAAKLKFRLEQGAHIIVEGSVGVYTPRGEYQFYATSIEPYGKGALALAYEQLKEKLKEKGYFDPAHKKPIPKNIRSLALVTAKESAALYDMLKIIEKRWPLLEVTIIDTLVQGERAAGEIARALRYADTLGVDVIVTGRGGGSVEDLWAFNEEIVADTIFSLATPVVSAVGHEVDVLISDFVADLRAPTPSAAMEMILPDRNEVLYTLDELLTRYRRQMEQLLFRKSSELKAASEQLQRLSVSRRLEQQQKSFESLRSEFERVMRYRLSQLETRKALAAEQLRQQMGFLIEQKRRGVQMMEQNYLANDPRNRVKEGWAKVYRDGKNTTLEGIEVDEIFILEDKSTKIEALCKKKSTF